MHYLTENNHFLLKRKAASDALHFKNFHLFGAENDVTTNDSLHNLFFVFSQKVLIAQTRLNVLLEDFDKMLSIKTILQQLLLI